MHMKIICSLFSFLSPPRGTAWPMPSSEGVPKGGGMTFSLAVGIDQLEAVDGLACDGTESLSLNEQTAGTALLA